MEWQRDAYTVSDDPARLDLDAICRLLWGTYWATDRKTDVIAGSLKNALSFGLYHGNEQIGIARVVTDRATVGYLCDVVISDQHRGSGLGKWLIACILAHPDLVDCRIDLFTRDAQEFYREFGFGPHRFTSMVRYPPDRGSHLINGGGE
jgi:GNAT superfamily N-acetyltransferase